MRRRVLRLRKLRMLFCKMSRGHLSPDGRPAGKTSHRQDTSSRRASILTKRVQEIHEGAYDELIEQIMQKPITEMQELYNNREIEK